MIAESVVASSLDRLGIETVAMPDGSLGVGVRVSVASLRQRFHGCTPTYIREVCGAACCRSSVSESGVSITVASDEHAALAAIERNGGVVVDGLVVPRPGERTCPNQDDDSKLCTVHGTVEQPFGCRASPFHFASGGRTLVVRNRYRRLRCYQDDRDGPAPPAYVAFGQALVDVFGPDVAAEIVATASDPSATEPFPAVVPAATYLRMRENTHSRVVVPLSLDRDDEEEVVVESPRSRVVADAVGRRLSSLRVGLGRRLLGDVPLASTASAPPAGSVVRSSDGRPKVLRGYHVTLVVEGVVHATSALEAEAVARSAVSSRGGTAPHERISVGETTVRRVRRKTDADGVGFSSDDLEAFERWGRERPASDQQSAATGH